MTTPGHEQFDPSVPQPWGTEPHPAQLAAQSGQAATQQTTTQQAATQQTTTQQAQNDTQAQQGQQYAITTDQAAAQNAAHTGTTGAASAKRWGTQTLIAATIGAAMVGAGGVAAANAFGADTTGTSQQGGQGGVMPGNGQPPQGNTSGS